MSSKPHHIIIYRITNFMLHILGAILFKFKATGREHIPKKGAFLLVSNHASWLDPTILAIGCPRRLTFMAKSDLFKKRLFGAYITALGAFPLEREGSKLEALKRSVEVLKKGMPLVMFPEGTRSKDGALQKPAQGVGFLAAKTNVPVVPAYIHGSHEAFPPGASRIKPHPIRVAFAKALYFDKEALDGDYQKFSDRVFEEIKELQRQCRVKK